MTTPLSENNKFEKAFTRDFTLTILEIIYKSEANNQKPWNGQIQKHLPYIIYWRTDGTVKMFYDSLGVDWIKNGIKNHIKENDDFLKKIEDNVREKLKLIQHIYEDEKTLNKKELILFIKNFEEAYTWIEPFWWLCHMYNDKEITDINIDSIIELRKKTDKLSSGTDTVVRKSLTLIFPKIKDFIHVLKLEEIKTENIPPLEELKKRDAGFFYTENKLFVNETKENIENKYKIILEEESTKKEITKISGGISYPGIVIGKVRRVMGHKDIPLIKEGEILVSPMTMPDFIIAMEKAAAFITDEGGILCHASIVAREMKKPCIVGTKIATKVLQDGDLVEINADIGIITILKKNK
ncbi:hypothetical protein HN865_01650 [Candidatus Woesearchaeota archaeon]|jgi:phosphohistidine swiveling domain-containing protein|nr:hypothetical protein [Candidatus Woesearchaeota archaeon]